MDWIREHVWASVFSVAGLLLIVIILIVQGRSTVLPQGSGAWSMEGSIPSSPGYETYGSFGGGSVPNPVLQTQGGSSVTSRPLAPENSVESGGAMEESDLASILLQLSGGAKIKTQGATTSEDFDIAKAYAMIPSSIIATTTAKKRTPAEQALYDYGNEVGSFIQAYETQHPNQAQVLKNQMEDRGDAQKGAALVSLAQGLVGIGQGMQKMEIVPESVRGMHDALSRSYAEIGGKLAQVPQAQGDKALVTAILSYDASVHTFVRNYAALATYFSVSNITFSPQDAGSVFSFTTARTF